MDDRDVIFGKLHILRLVSRFSIRVATGEPLLDYQIRLRLRHDWRQFGRTGLQLEKGLGLSHS